MELAAGCRKSQLLERAIQKPQKEREAGEAGHQSKGLFLLLIEENDRLMLGNGVAKVGHLCFPTHSRYQVGQQRIHLLESRIFLLENTYRI